MRARSVTAFVWGFVAGMICVALLVWRVGPVARDSHSETQIAQAAAPPAAAPAPVIAKPPPVRKLTPPPEEAMNLETGSAHMDAAQSGLTALIDRQLAMPVAGYDPAKLIDTFDDPRGAGARKHEALDIMAERGTPVVAADEGNIVKLFESKQGGLTIYQFDNTQTWCFYYGHLDRYAEGLKQGMLVRKGETIAYVGSTGDAAENAPHLHFAIFKLGPEKQWWKGEPVNPYPVLAR